MCSRALTSSSSSKGDARRSLIHNIIITRVRYLFNPSPPPTRPSPFSRSRKTVSWSSSRVRFSNEARGEETRDPHVKPHTVFCMRPIRINGVLHFVSVLLARARRAQRPRGEGLYKYVLACDLLHYAPVQRKSLRFSKLAWIRPIECLTSVKPPPKWLLSRAAI